MRCRRTPLSLLPLAVLASFSAPGCGLLGGASAPQPEPTVDGAAVVEDGEEDDGGRALGGDWLTIAASAFAARVERWGSEPLGFRFGEDARAELARSLDVPGTPATRAAVLLAHAAAGDDGVWARIVLTVRLERRRAGGARPLVAGDVVAAGALAPHARRVPAVAGLLTALADGDRPHPDLAVRVEAAVGALAAGRDEVVPFLLRVLRAETPAQELDPPDWPRMTTLAWVKTRAAGALARRAGVENAFRPDGSWQHQVDEAARLERLLSGG